MKVLKGIGKGLFWLVVVALLAAPDAESLALLSQTIIPACNLFFAFVFFPAILLTGRRRGRI